MDTIQRQTLSISEAAEILGVSRGLIYNQIVEGNIKAIHIGRKIVIARTVIEEILGQPLPQ